MTRVALAFLIGCLAATSGRAGAQDAPQAKTIRLLISSGPGAIYDLYGRLVARHLGAFLPGNPGVAPENMTGADGLNAANYLYNTAPRDGSVIATFNSAIAFYQALSFPGVRFKAERFAWLGSIAQPTALVVVWHTAGVQSLADAQRQELVMGATGAVGTMAGTPAFLNSVFGTRFKIVSGYDSANAVDLAIERGEVQGRAIMTWPTLMASKPSWIADHKIVPILQIGPRKDPHLPDVPLLNDLATGPDQRRMFAFVSSTVSLGQPFAAGPDLPADRRAALRSAFEKMGHDPAFLADAAKLAGTSMDGGVIAGAETERIVYEAITTPASLVETVKSAMHVR